MIFNREELQNLIKEKGLKSTDDLNSLIKDVSKEVIEVLYDGEITDHLGHQKNRKSENGNVRNGRSRKKVQSKW